MKVKWRRRMRKEKYELWRRYMLNVSSECRGWDVKVKDKIYGRSFFLRKIFYFMIDVNKNF